jgi:CelD/BcsL family acetyltransferase involved in cellulose biosynthesis
VKVARVVDSPQLRARWDELAVRSGNIFSTPEWVDAWWRHLGAGNESDLFSLAEGDEVVGVAAIARGPVGPVKAARFAGYGPADAMGPACAAERLPEAMRALAGADLGAPVLLAERLPADAAGPPFVPFGREASPIVDLGGDWDAYLAGKSSNFRSQVRRKERKLIREHGLTYRLADAAGLDADLDVLFRLHERRWDESGSGAFAGARAGFHREFAATALERGWLRLWMAEVGDGEPVAAWYGFRFAGEEWYYQAGREPEWDRSSVGLVLLAQTMRAAAEEGVDTYRLLRGDDSYKDRFATGDAPVVTLAAGRGPGAQAGVRAARRLGEAELVRRGIGRLSRRGPLRASAGLGELASLIRGA